MADSAASTCSEQALAGQGIDVFHGSAAFDAYDTVLVDGKTRVEGSRFVIATGSRPAQPTIPGLAEAGFLNTSSLWSLTKVPASLVVLGAGPYRSRVRPGLRAVRLEGDGAHRQGQSVLPREDVEVSGTVACMLTGEGITFNRGVTIEKIEPRGDQKVCVYKDMATGDVAEVTAAEIFCAAGRLANVERSEPRGGRGARRPGARHRG